MDVTTLMYADKHTDVNTYMYVKTLMHMNIHGLVTTCTYKNTPTYRH